MPYAPENRPPNSRKVVRSVPPPSKYRPEPPRGRRFNRTGIVIAFIVAIALVPFTLRHQQQRFAHRDPARTDYSIPHERRQWQMTGLDGMTEKQAIDRFGTPSVTRNFDLADGAFAGPFVGPKHFVPKTLPDYEKRLKAAELVWEFPQFSAIREMVWQLSDSYLTVWFREPRADINLGSKDDSTEMTLPVSPEDRGDWVAIDNYRVGKDLLKSNTSAVPTGTPLETN